MLTGHFMKTGIIYYSTIEFYTLYGKLHQQIINPDNLSKKVYSNHIIGYKVTLSILIDNFSL